MNKITTTCNQKQVETKSFLPAKFQEKESLFHKIVKLAKIFFNFIKEQSLNLTRSLCSLLKIKATSIRAEKPVPAPEEPTKKPPLSPSAALPIDLKPPLALKPELPPFLPTTVPTEPSFKLQQIPLTAIQAPVEKPAAKSQPPAEPAIDSEDITLSDAALLATNILPFGLNLAPGPVSYLIGLSNLLSYERVAQSFLKSGDLSFKERILHTAVPLTLSIVGTIARPELSLGLLACQTAYKAHRTFLMAKNTLMQIKKPSGSKKWGLAQVVRTMNTLFAISSTLTLAKATHNALTDNSSTLATPPQRAKYEAECKGNYKKAMNSPSLTENPVMHGVLSQGGRWVTRIEWAFKAAFDQKKINPCNKEEAGYLLSLRSSDQTPPICPLSPTSIPLYASSLCDYLGKKTGLDNPSEIKSVLNLASQTLGCVDANGAPNFCERVSLILAEHPNLRNSHTD